MIKVIIFDYDGVIVDSFSEVHKTYLKMCKELGKKCPGTLEGFKKIYGHSSSEAYNQLGFSEEDILKGNEIYKREVGNSKPTPFEGIKEVLEVLSKDYLLIVLSSSYNKEIGQKLKNFGLMRYFKDILGRESVKIKRFEKVGAIKEILKKYNLDSSEILLIGDRNVDFSEGSRAGLKNILLVDYGWGYDLSLIPEYSQKVLVKNPEEIPNAIKKY